MLSDETANFWLLELSGNSGKVTNIDYGNIENVNIENEFNIENGNIDSKNGVKRGPPWAQTGS